MDVCLDVVFLNACVCILYLMDKSKMAKIK